MKEFRVLVEFSTAAYITIDAENEQDAIEQLENPNWGLTPDVCEMEFCDLGTDRHISKIEDFE